MKLQIHKYLDPLFAIISPDVNILSMRWDKFNMLSMYWCDISIEDLGETIIGTLEIVMGRLGGSIS